MNKVNDNDFIVGGGYNEKDHISISFNYSIDVFCSGVFCSYEG